MNMSLFLKDLFGYEAVDMSFNGLFMGLSLK